MKFIMIAIKRPMIFKIKIKYYYSTDLYAVEFFYNFF